MFTRLVHVKSPLLGLLGHQLIGAPNPASIGGVFLHMHPGIICCCATASAHAPDKACRLRDHIG